MGRPTVLLGCVIVVFGLAAMDAGNFWIGIPSTVVGALVCRAGQALIRKEMARRF